MGLAGLNQATSKARAAEDADFVAPVVAQPLYVGAVNIKGRLRSAVFVATATNKVYAFNADPPFDALWSTSLGPPYAPSEHRRIATTAVYRRQQPSAATLSRRRHRGDAGDRRRAQSHVRQLSRRPSAPRRAAPRGTRHQDGAGATRPDSGNDEWHEQHRSRASLLVDNGIVFVAFGALDEGSKTAYRGWIHAFNARTLKPLGRYRSVPDSTDAANLAGIDRTGR